MCVEVKFSYGIQQELCVYGKQESKFGKFGVWSCKRMRVSLI